MYVFRYTRLAARLTTILWLISILLPLFIRTFDWLRSLFHSKSKSILLVIGTSSIYIKKKMFCLFGYSALWRSSFSLSSWLQPILLFTWMATNVRPWMKLSTRWKLKNFKSPPQEQTYKFPSLWLLTRAYCQNIIFASFFFFFFYSISLSCPHPNILFVPLYAFVWQFLTLLVFFCLRKQIAVVRLVGSSK